MLTLAMLILVFLIPVILASSLYLVRDNFNLSSGQSGELVVPLVPVKPNWLPAWSKNTGRFWTLVSFYEQTDEPLHKFHKKTLEDLQQTLGIKRDKLKLLYQKITDIKQAPMSVQAKLNKQSIWLIDPYGNLMMTYGPEIPWHGVLSDVRKLMKNMR